MSDGLSAWEHFYHMNNKPIQLALSVGHSDKWHIEQNIERNFKNLKVHSEQNRHERPNTAA